MKKGVKYGVPIVAGMLVLPLPLLGNFHIESALVVSVIGAFWAALRACKYRDMTGRREFHVPLGILVYCYIFGLPLLLYAVFTGCFSINGLGFWIFYPIPSVFFSYAIGRLLRKWQFPFCRLIAVSILLFISAGVWVIEFFHFPQVYFFNHIWGGWPGPIYDETVKVGWSLLFYRVLTLTWTALLWKLPAVRKSTRAALTVIICCGVLIAGYSHLPDLGIITPRSYLQKQLGGKKETPHFILYYDKSHYSKDEISFIAEKHEFYYRQITGTLQLNPESSAGKIESYLYGHAWQKKALVGAKFTSYVPIWLQQDQLHIAKQQVEGSLKHEMVHVLAKRFGNALFNGSWSIGLIEGVAVAVAPDASPVSTINQIVASQAPYPTVQEMKSALLPLGFYGGRSAVNYTQSGSFVQYLLQYYPVDSLKKAYRTGSISAAYSTSFEQLVKGWHRRLDSVKVDSTDRKIAALLYSLRSLFEQACPHVQSAFAVDWDRYRYFMAEKDTTSALKYLDEAQKEAPKNMLVTNRWAFLNLETGHFKKVEEEAVLTDTTTETLLLYADAFAMGQKMNEARRYIAAAARLLQQTPDSTLAPALHIRRNLDQWKAYRQMIYSNKAFDGTSFRKLAYRTQIRAIQQALKNENWNRAWLYARIIQNKKINVLYFNTAIKLVEWMAFKGKMRPAREWLKKVKSLPLRPRYRERMEETACWVHFVSVK